VDEQDAMRVAAEAALTHYRTETLASQRQMEDLGYPQVATSLAACVAWADDQLATLQA
jgi:hypothetical protein